MTILSAAQQVREVARKFPTLKLVHNFGWLIIWEGTLRSFSAEYRIRIFWHRYWPEDWKLPVHRPQIFMIDPPMEDRPDGRVPHAYPGVRSRSLCVFDPASEDDWDHSQSIADTIIPYTIQWLCTYELWHLTGDWNAPGRHPDGGNQCRKNSSQPSDSRDQQARSIRAAIDRVGRLTRTSASLALMGAASGESCRWLSWRNWKRHTFQGGL